MSNTHCNMFVVHTPFQMFMARHMVREMAEFSGADNVLVTDMEAPGFGGESGRWSQIVQNDPPIGGHISGKAAEARRVRASVIDLLSGCEGARLFLANLMWPMNNAVFHAARRRGVRICIYPEGLGSLCLARLSVKQKTRNAVKAVLGKLGGFPFHYVSSDMMGVLSADCVYSLDPEVVRTWVRAEVREIPMLSCDRSVEPADECLFVGQNYADRMSEAEFAPVCEEVARYVGSLGHKRCWYKRHHTVTNRLEEKVFLQHGFEPFEERRPIEEIFQTSPLACVVSFNSSALIHLKMMLGERVRCIACHSSRMLRTTSVRHEPRDWVAKLYQRYGVEEWPA